MYTPTTHLLALCVLAGHAISAPLLADISPRQASPCFIVGKTALPAETQDLANSLASSITCDPTIKTIGNVPDVKSSSTTFSSINFANSSSTPLQFALDKFATSTPLASSDLNTIQSQLDVYGATEAGIRSEGGSLAIKIPKFFLAFQAARVKTAQGVSIQDPGQTVEHLLGKVMSNAKGESKTLLDQVQALSTQLT